MATIYDVAKEAGVSLATVSAVVNGTAYVSPGLKGRVTTAIQKLSYQPNLLARSLAKQQTHTIGVIVLNIANPFWPEVVRGIEDAAHSAGYTLLLASGDDDRAKEALYLRLFLAKRVDGLLITEGPRPARSRRRGAPPSHAHARGPDDAVEQRNRGGPSPGRRSRGCL